MKKPVPSSAEINDELTKLLAQQSDYFKRRSHTRTQIKEFERSRDRIRELFKQIAVLKAA